MSEEEDNLEFGEIPLDDSDEEDEGNVEEEEEHVEEERNVEEEIESAASQSNYVKSEYDEIVIQPVDDSESETQDEARISSTSSVPMACHVCRFCDSTFERALLLEAHMRIHIWGCEETKNSDISSSDSGNVKMKQKFVSCQFCELTFPNHGLLNRHRLDRHRLLYTCSVCRRTYEKDYMWRHMQDHIDKDKIECKVCLMRHSSLLELNRHMLIHSEERHRCILCRKVFMTESFLNNHMAKHRTTTKKTKIEKTVTKVVGLPCAICPKVFLNEDYLKKHLATHIRIPSDISETSQAVPQNKKVRKEFFCNKCYVDQGSVAALRAHINGRCNVKIATEYLNDESYLQEKLGVHFGDKCVLRPFKCFRCGRGFETASDLDKHMNSFVCSQSEETMDFKNTLRCHVCGLEFETLTRLKTHFEIMHSDEVEGDSINVENPSSNKSNRPFIFHCFSPDSFSEAETGGETEFESVDMDEDCPLYVCGVCNRSYLRKCSLTRHVQRVHPKQAHNLFMPLRKRSAEKKLLLPCGFCPKKFLLTQTLREHIENVHGILIEKEHFKQADKHRHRCHLESYLNKHPQAEMKIVKSGDHTPNGPWENPNAASAAARDTQRISFIDVSDRSHLLTPSNTLVAKQGNWTIKTSLLSVKDKGVISTRSKPKSETVINIEPADCATLNTRSNSKNENVINIEPKDCTTLSTRSNPKNETVFNIEPNDCTTLSRRSKPKNETVINIEPKDCKTLSTRSDLKNENVINIEPTDCISLSTSSNPKNETAHSVHKRDTANGGLMKEGSKIPSNENNVQLSSTETSYLNMIDKDVASLMPRDCTTLSTRPSPTSERAHSQQACDTANGDILGKRDEHLTTKYIEQPGMSNNPRKRKRKDDLKPREDFDSDVEFTTYEENQIVSTATGKGISIVLKEGLGSLRQTSPSRGVNSEKKTSTVNYGHLQTEDMFQSTANINTHNNWKEWHKDDSNQRLDLRSEIYIRSHFGKHLELEEADNEGEMQGPRGQPSTDNSMLGIRIKVYPCKKCKAILYSAALLEDHMQKAHPALLKCDVCTSWFITVEGLMAHVSLFHTQHVCGYCRRANMTWKKLKEHVKYCLNNNKEGLERGLLHPCNECHLSFRCKLDLDRHKILSHTRKIVFSCLKCHKQFHSKEALQSHIVDMHSSPTGTDDGGYDNREKGFHESIGTYSCQTCDKRYLKLTSLLDHELKHQDRANELISCPICDVQLRTSDLMSHIESHPDQPKKGLKKTKVTNAIDTKEEFTCTVCLSVYNSYGPYLQHTLTHTKPQIYCRLCRHLCEGKRSLGRHIATLHLADEIFECGLCGISFGSQYQLKKHMENHKVQDLHVCRFCCKGFPDKPWLIKHSMTHKGRDQVLRCEVCKKKDFKTLRALWLDKVEHFMEGKGFYNCRVCASAFVFRSQLQKHWKMEHGSKKKAEKPSHNKMCDLCNMSFKSRSAYAVHMRRHLAYNSFPSPFLNCSFCIRGFESQKDVINHITYVHGIQNSLK